MYLHKSLFHTDIRMPTFREVGMEQPLLYKEMKKSDTGLSATRNPA
jgi:hypothetical protein